MRKGLDPKTRAERRRCLRIIEAWRVSFVGLRDQPGSVGETARARVDMANKLADAVEKGVRS